MINETEKKERIQAIFIDRDGTIGEADKDLDPHHFVTYPNFYSALGLLKANDVKIFAFTNQPDIARGLVHEKLMIQQYTSWGFDHAYICPHTDEMKCACRKPLPGMLLQATRTYGLDLAKCAVIGDSWKDIIAGDTVGCIKILVKTGDGQNIQEQIQDVIIHYHANDFFDGVNWVVKNI